MRLPTLGVMFLVAFTVVGCAYPVPARAYRGGYYAPPPVVVVPAPPPVVVAPAPPPPPPPQPRVVVPQGYVQYTYYPAWNVYLDPISGLYWSLQGGTWFLGNLPPHLHYERLGHGYVVIGEEGRPWRRHHHGGYGPRGYGRHW